MPSGTPSDEGVYLTVYPSSCPNTDTYLEYSGATFATHHAGKALGLSASSALSRQDQARSFIRMHLVRAIDLPKLYCTLHIKFSSLDICINKLVSSTLCKFDL